MSSKKENKYWSGKGLGLPEKGKFAIASLTIRFFSVLIDWIFASILSYAFFRGEAFATLGIYIVIIILFQFVILGSPGQIIVGIRIVIINGNRFGFFKILLRTVLLSFLIPAIIWDKDRRGIHDKLSGTAVINFRE